MKLTKLWQRIGRNKKNKGNADSSPNIIDRSDHALSRKDMSEHALKVLYRLKKARYEGYLVGGGVRDLLLGMHPKDFDVATNATPEQVRKLFGNCRLIGRRFRLAHGESERGRGGRLHRGGTSNTRSGDRVSPGGFFHPDRARGLDPGLWSPGGPGHPNGS